MRIRAFVAFMLSSLACFVMALAVTLSELGWNDFFAQAFAALPNKGWVPARLIRETAINFGAMLQGGEEVELSLIHI